MDEFGVGHPQMTAPRPRDVAGVLLDPPDALGPRRRHLLVELGRSRPTRPMTAAAGSARVVASPGSLSILGLGWTAEAERNGCVREDIAAAALSIQDPRERPVAAQQAAAEAHRRPRSRGRTLAYVRPDYLREQQRALFSSQFRKLCRAEYLNYLRVREWQDLYSQLRQVAAGCASAGPRPVIPTGTSRCSPGCSRRSACGTAPPASSAARGAKFAIAPGSSLAKKPPWWVMAAELVETNRLWGRVAPPASNRAGGAARRTPSTRLYGEPRWDARRGAAGDDRAGPLSGLPIVAARLIGLDRVQPLLAQMFIRHALGRRRGGTYAFLLENRRFVEEVRAFEDLPGSGSSARRRRGVRLLRPAGRQCRASGRHRPMVEAGSGRNARTCCC